LSFLADKTLTCRDCGRSFPFTVREQEFYAEKGFNNQPGRCPECRAAYKARQNGGVAPTPTASFDRPERQMYPAVCATCGKATQVPFEPRLGRPVYCRDCFVPPQRSSGDSFERSPSFGSAPSADRGSSFGSGSGSSGSRDRSSSFGSAPVPEQRRPGSKQYDRRSDWNTSYDRDSDDDSDSPSDRRSGRGRRS